MARPGTRLLGPLGWRLFAAFVLVAVALLAALAVASVRSQTSGLVAAQRDQARQDIAAALAGAYARAGSWTGADLAGAQALARSTGAQLIILDAAGGQVATVMPGHDQDQMPGHDATPTPGHGTGGTGRPAPEPSGMHRHGDALAPVPATSSIALAAATALRTAAADRVPVVVDGTTVGTVVIDFPPASQTAAWQARDAIVQVVGFGAMAAVALAGAAALFVSRRTTRPLTALAAAAGAMERGDPDAARLLRPGPGELGQVSTAFARMAATLAREDELRRGMVADIAHELRTPVTILQGGTEELLDGIADPTPARLTSLHDETLRLGRLVDDLAILAAAQAAALTLHRAPADLGKIAAQAAGALEPQFTDAGLDLTIDAAPAPIHADEARITQIITNLLTNAAKFTPPGGQVTLTTRADSATARLTVADTGPGIPAADLPHIFERFWRGPGAAGRSGSGIGLAVATELAAAHDGTLTAASPPGSGAIFTLSLPAA